MILWTFSSRNSLAGLFFLFYLYTAVLFSVLWKDFKYLFFQISTVPSVFPHVVNGNVLTLPLPPSQLTLPTPGLSL